MAVICKYTLLLGRLTVAFLLLLSIEGRSEPHSQNHLNPSARFSMAGDSITAFKNYSAFVEAYLLVCGGRSDVQAFQFGVGGDTTSGFNNRIESNLSLFSPTTLTLCFGMNDGGYAPFNIKTQERYAGHLRGIIKKARSNGVTRILLASPGCVDTRYFRPGQTLSDGKQAAISYNQTLKALRDTAERIAKEEHLTFIDIHTVLSATMAKAKTVLGDDYAVCGPRDGIHPGPNGGLVMAYVFLKALGFNGSIGRIEIDMDGGATVTAGHQINSADTGRVELMSRRFPFCFTGDTTLGTRSILPFFPFNRDLNQFILKVKNLTTNRARVTWGQETREFSASTLRTGVNLAVEFKTSPFDTDFEKILTLIRKKQSFEVMLVKDYGWATKNLRQSLQENPEALVAIDTLEGEFMAHWEKLNAEVRAAYRPVKHRLIVTPID